MRREPGQPDEIYICHRHYEPDQTAARELYERLTRLGFRAGAR